MIQTEGGIELYRSNISISHRNQISRNLKSVLINENLCYKPRTVAKKKLKNIVKDHLRNQDVTQKRMPRRILAKEE